jgi:predicted ATPase
MDLPPILTPDQRLRVFVSSTLDELADERAAARRAIEQLRLTPVMFEMGARPHPPRRLYLAYLRQSHVFVGIYGEQYGWIAPDLGVSGVEDELRHADDLPLLLYVQMPAPGRKPRLNELIADLEHTGATSYKTFSTAAELEKQIGDDLAVLLTERFASEVAPSGDVRVPHPASEFVGRRKERAELVDLVTDEGVRLVTLTGPGGIGKTRLAIEVGRTVADKFLDGVTFVPLAARAPEDFLEAVCASVGLQDLGQQPLPDLLVEHLRDRRQLLVLDNAEQLLPAAGQIAQLVERTVSLRVLVTSRTALRLSGEEEFPVPPLGLPRVTQRVEEVGRAEAAQLFCRRVAAIRHGFVLTEQDAATVARICRRLDGLPLALELVAARANVLSIDELAERLDKVLDLSTRSPDAPQRQRTLRQTMDWSLSQLPADAAGVFARLGVFVGPFSFSAAQAVCDTADDNDLLDTLAVLVDHSLLRPQVTTGTSRFSMLEIVRQYARSRLAPAAYEEARQRHADYYRDIAVTAFTGLRRTAQRATVDKLDLDADDMAAALDWLLAHGQRVQVADMCWAMWLYFWLRNSVTEGRRWTRGALDAEGPLPDIQRARLLAADGFLTACRRDYLLAHAELLEALAIAEREGDDDVRMLASIMMIVVVGGVGDESVARSFAVEALRVARERGDRWAEAICLTGLCSLIAAAGAIEAEEKTFDEMIEAAREMQDPLIQALALGNMAEVRIWQDRWNDAAALLVDSLTRLVDLRMADLGLGSLHSTAWLLTLTGDPAGAVHVQAAADSVANGMNAGLWPPWLPRRERLLADAQERLGESTFDQARSLGHEWTFEQAADDAVTRLARLPEHLGAPS